MNETIQRRQFLSRSMQVGALAPFAWHTRRLGTSEQVHLAIIGSGARGRRLGTQFAAAGALVTCLCDVDSRAVEASMAAVSKVQTREPRGERDFRRVLDDKTVDAVVIATPDHWHVPLALHALAAGKHVYVEKPLSHNPHEGELMVAAANKYGRSVQFGIQRRSSAVCIELIEKLHAGVIGRLSYARGWYARKRKPIGQGQKIAVPESLDFDLWQGPAPRRDYRDNLLPYNWHWFWHWGTGELGNNGPHALDLCRWGLSVKGHPRRVTSGGGTYSHQDDQETPDTQVVTYDYGEVGITFEHRNWHASGLLGSSFGAAFYGSRGTAVCDGASYRILDPGGAVLAEAKGDRGDTAHTEGFLRRVRTDDASTDSIEEGHKTTLLCHLGNIAFRSGQQLDCDPETGHIREGAAAQALWRREYEAGWEPSV